MYICVFEVRRNGVGPMHFVVSLSSLSFVFASLLPLNASNSAVKTDC